MSYEHGGDVFEKDIELDFSVNTNPYGMPKSVIQAAKQGVLQGQYYPDYRNRKLCEALGNMYGIPKEYIRCSNGAAAMIYEVVQALKPQKGMVIAPSFLEYEKALKSVGTEIFYYQLNVDTDFEVDEGIFSLLAEKKPEILFLCNPNNPTGKLCKKPFLEQLLRVCRDEHIRLIVDECFLGFTQEESMACYLEAYPNLFLISAFTKLYCMPGLRSGYGMCADLELLCKIDQIRQDWNVSWVAEAASIAALKEWNYVEKTRQEIAEQRRYLIKNLQKIGLKVNASDANFLLVYSDRDLYQECLRYRILLRDCSNFKGLQKGYYRIAVRTQQENERLIQVLGEIIHG